jgi:hypothetical protein
MILIFLSNQVSACALKYLRCSKTSNFFLRKNTQVYHEKLSINVSMYLSLLMDRRGKDPIISLRMISKGEEALQSLPFIKILLGMFIKNTSSTKSFGKMYVGKVDDHFLFA